VSNDLRDTPEYAAVAEHLRRLHEPAFGLPHEASEPDVSADGTRVVVTGSVFDELAGLPRTAIFTVGSGGLRPVTTGPGSARQGKFAPDGTTLAFLSDRACPEVFQLFLLADGRLGEAVAAPEAPGTVEYALWSPDGQHILLGVAGHGADKAGGQGSGTNSGADADLPPWYPAVDAGIPDDGWRSLWLYATATGELSKLSPDGLNCWEAGWCGPDQVVAITSDRPGEDDWYGAVLTLIDRATGHHRELLRSQVQLGLPAGSPDGAKVAVVQAVCSDRWLVAGDLILIDQASGAVTAIGTAGTDVTSVRWIDRNRLGYFGQRHLDSVAGIVDPATGLVTELLATALSCGGRYPDGAFTADGRVVVVQDAYHLPHQVSMVSPEKEEVLASLAHAGTDYLVSVAGTARAISWSAADGLMIEGILCAPAGDGPFPLIVNIHGGPIWAYRNKWSMHNSIVPLLVSRGYAVLHPNPRGSSGRGQGFAGRVVGDMGGADTGDYLAGIDALVRGGGADPARVGLFGGSYGGFMSSWLVTQDQRFAAAVPVSPVTDWYSQSFTSNIGGWGTWFLDADPEQPGTAAHTRSPVLQASKVRTPCLNVAGARDRCTPAGQAREFHQALLAHGVESVLVVYPQEGHGVRSYPAATDLLTRAASWFERHMPPGAGS
jgi:dipeptidyl aminopeptidase/acylaminoacyl peptidase